MQVGCRVLHQHENLMEEEKIVRIAQLMKKFFSRFKMEHEEESNLTVSLFSEKLRFKHDERSSMMAEQTNQQGTEGCIDYDRNVSELFRILFRAAQKSNDWEYEMEDSDRTFGKIGYKSNMVEAAATLFANLMERNYTNDENIK